MNTDNCKVPISTEKEAQQSRTRESLKFPTSDSLDQNESLFNKNDINFLRKHACPML